MHVRRLPRAADFRLDAAGIGPEAAAHVIGVIENQAPTTHLRLKVAVSAGEVRADPGRDIAKLALLDRHHASGRIQVGLVQGFGLRGKCAVGTTVAHDCHQMLVVGTDEENMALAASELVAARGGQVVVKDGKVIGMVALPIAGLMSDQPAAVVARAAASVLEGFRQCGCRLNNPNMQLSLLGLVVIPELRISDRGLIDVVAFAPIAVLE
jgi:adenine deaminase